MDGDEIFLRAKYNFLGKNNDELCFQKNDIIVLTQKPDGGWWEGTLDAKTGWFPSNYVNQIPKGALPDPASAAAKSPSGRRTPNRNANVVVKPAERIAYRNLILKELIESEKKHAEELKTLFNTYLEPMSRTSVISHEEYDKLVGNLGTIIESQKQFMETLQSHSGKQNAEQRIGKEFMEYAPKLKVLLKIYCSNHPLAVEIINRKRSALDQFMVDHGGTLMTLIQSLSQPFRRLERYPNFLQELERNMEENHSDRGDTQRAVSVYRKLSEFCTDVRKQKEMQMELVAGSVEGLESDVFEGMGDIQLMSAVMVVDFAGSSDKEDRVLVAFPQDLVVFSVGLQLNAYQFRRRVPLKDLIVKRSESPRYGPYCLETAGSTLTHSLVVIFPSAAEQSRWLEFFQAHPGVTYDDQCNIISPSEPLRFETNVTEVSPAVLPQVSMMPSPGHAELKKSSTLPPGMSLAANRANGLPNGHGHAASAGPSSSSAKDVSFRPYPANRGPQPSNPRRGDPVKLRKSKAPPPTAEHDDNTLLEVVEGYFTGGRVRPNFAVSGMQGLVDLPNVIVAEDEKIIFEETVNGETIIHEKTLVDTVYALKDQVDALKFELGDMKVALDKERRSRRRLEELVRKHIPGIPTSGAPPSSATLNATNSSFSTPRGGVHPTAPIPIAGVNSNGAVGASALNGKLSSSGGGAGAKRSGNAATNSSGSDNKTASGSSCGKS